MTTETKNRPDFNVYTRRVNGNGETSLGTQIGVGFSHGKGGGLNIQLEAMPIPLDGKVSLVVFPVKDKS